MENAEQEDLFVDELLQAQRPLRSFIVAQLGVGPDVDDVMQEVSIILWRKREQWDRSRPFLPWVFGVARLQVLERLRQQARGRVVFNSELTEQMAERFARLEPVLQSRRAALRLCLRRLDAGNYDLLCRHYAAGEPLTQIAKGLGKQVNAIYTRLSRLRDRLAECVGRVLQRTDLPDDDLSTEDLVP